MENIYDIKDLFGKDIPPIMLAPMAGAADRTMRLLCREYGADLTVSEMVSA
ncbi:MAG: tRNA-dihydrouridine synthase, partial [Clostridia bacterium]|nr:tRNA-dihydrouridine synthase [Clostridia bacterium]